MAKLDLTKYGISGVTEIVHNPSFEELFAAETDPTLEGFEKGQLTEDEAKNHPNKNIITRALGVASYIDIDFDEREVLEGDTVLLCTDGLTNCIDDDLIKLACSDNDFASLAERLTELANQNGGNDNITVVAVKI